MTFCGYDPEMGEGLTKFGKGVATSTLKKAADAGHAIGKQLDVEIVQLGSLVDALELTEKNSADKGVQHRAKALKGLAEVCLSAFLTADGIDDEETLQQHFRDQFTLFGELVRKLEDAFEGAPSGMGPARKTALAVQLTIAI